MPLPETLDDAIRGAKSYISRADPITAQVYCKNAIASLHNSVGYAMPDEDIQLISEYANTQIEALRVALAGQWGPAARDRAQTARQNALQAVDRLEVALATARPNDMAKALGLDWY